MKTKIYLLVSEWGREDGQDTDVEVYTSLQEAQHDMRRHYRAYLNDYKSYDHADVADYCDDMSAGISVDGNYDYMHDTWKIVEKVVDFGERYIVATNHANFAVAHDPFWLGNMTAAVCNGREADKLERELKKDGYKDAFVVKLTNLTKGEPI